MSVPPFGGPFYYPQQWLPPNPSPSNPFPPMSPQEFNTNGNYNAGAYNANMGNIHRNPSLPGLGGLSAPGTLPTPGGLPVPGTLPTPGALPAPLPFMNFPPPPFPPFPVSPMVFPPVTPVPTGVGQEAAPLPPPAASSQTAVDNTHLRAPEPRASTSKAESDREEGEVSDMDGDSQLRSKQPGPGEQGLTKQPEHTPNGFTGSRASQSSRDFERPAMTGVEPENANSSRSRTSPSERSSRDSGSRIVPMIFL